MKIFFRALRIVPGPFCIKVRQEMRRLSLDIELRDAKNDPQHRAALLQGGGTVKVPCLRITDARGNSQWMNAATCNSVFPGPCSLLTLIKPRDQHVPA